MRVKFDTFGLVCYTPLPVPPPSGLGGGFDVWTMQNWRDLSWERKINDT
jgi:hypothetical protein